MPAICYMLSAICMPSAFRLLLSACLLPSAFGLPSAICHPLIRYLLSAMCMPSFLSAICYLLSAICYISCLLYFLPSFFPACLLLSACLLPSAFGLPFAICHPLIRYLLSAMFMPSFLSAICYLLSAIYHAFFISYRPSFLLAFLLLPVLRRA